MYFKSYSKDTKNLGENLLPYSYRTIYKKKFSEKDIVNAHGLRPDLTTTSL